MATLIFIIAIIILFFYAINFLSKSDEKLEEIFYEGNLASSLVLSDDEVGILTGDRVDQAKLDSFANSYDTKKADIGVIRDFYFTMDYLEVNGDSAAYVGKMNVTQTENLIQITRITTYKNKPVKFQLYVWE